VASYFRFVRTMLYINILMAIPLICFIVVPEVGRILNVLSEYIIM